MKELTLATIKGPCSFSILGATTANREIVHRRCRGHTMQGIIYIDRQLQFEIVVPYATAKNIVAALGYPEAIRDRLDARSWGDSKIHRFVLRPIVLFELERISWFDSFEYEAGYSTGCKTHFGEFGDPNAVYQFGFYFEQVNPACWWLDPGRL